MTLKDDVDEFVALQVAVGRSTPDQIVDEAIEYLEDDADSDEVKALATASVGAAIEAHLAAQAGWPAVTDNDRLTAAFAALDDAGIIAREDFSCCQNCGAAEIGDVDIDDPDRIRGYTFYHQQDTESAASGGGIYLAYGPFNASPEPGVDPVAAIGREVADALQEQGLTVDWDGSTRKRIGVRVTWQKRR